MATSSPIPTLETVSQRSFDIYEQFSALIASHDDLAVRLLKYEEKYGCPHTPNSRHYGSADHDEVRSAMYRMYDAHCKTSGCPTRAPNPHSHVIETKDRSFCETSSLLLQPIDSGWPLKNQHESHKAAALPLPTLSIIPATTLLSETLSQRSNECLSNNIDPVFEAQEREVNRAPQLHEAALASDNLNIKLEEQELKFGMEFREAAIATNPLLQLNDSSALSAEEEEREVDLALDCQEVAMTTDPLLQLNEPFALSIMERENLRHLLKDDLYARKASGKDAKTMFAQEKFIQDMTERFKKRREANKADEIGDDEDFSPLYGILHSIRSANGSGTSKQFNWSKLIGSLLDGRHYCGAHCSDEAREDPEESDNKFAEIVSIATLVDEECIVETVFDDSDAMTLVQGGAVSSRLIDVNSNAVELRDDNNLSIPSTLIRAANADHEQHSGPHRDFSTGSRDNRPPPPIKIIKLNLRKQERVVEWLQLNINDKVQLEAQKTAATVSAFNSPMLAQADGVWHCGEKVTL